jgi:hypothetical protein
MEVEDSIAAGDQCTLDQMRLLGSIPLLSKRSIARYLAAGGCHKGHLDKAQMILDKRATYFGWKDYVYCYLNTPDFGHTKESRRLELLDIMLDYVTSSPIREPLGVLFSLLLGCSLLSVPNARTSGYQWKYFCKGVWINIDNSQVCRMIHSRIEEDDLIGRLGLHAREANSAIAAITRSMTHSNTLVNRLFCPMFKESCDPKEETFAMPACTYDMMFQVVRIGLPGDKSTMRGGVDPDMMEWHKRRKGMLKVFRDWLDQYEVVDSYLGILAGALSEFKPRYAVVNSGTGSDGKSTFFHILEKIFGSYCAVTPNKGPSPDTSNANDATPFANRLVGRRLSLTGDSGDVVKLVTSPGFKSASGGDSTYLRSLHQEANEYSPRLKMLSIVNTNQSSMVLPAVAELTRIKVFKWLHKIVTDEDRAIIPAHQLKNFAKGIFDYENKFMRTYGKALMTELILRHGNLLAHGMRIPICDTVKDWTLMSVGPKTILSFLRQCTQRDSLSESDVVVPQSEEYDYDIEPSVEELFVVYTNWRRRGIRLSPTDPNSLVSFRTHLEFYHPIDTRDDVDGEPVEYVQGLYLKPETQLLSFTSHGAYMPSGLIGSILGPKSIMQGTQVLVDDA